MAPIMLLISLAVFGLGTVAGVPVPDRIPVNCTDPKICFKDAKPYCMQSGRTVFGHCGLKQAVCIDGDMWDPTDACKDLPYKIDCGPDPQPCAMDLIHYCMTSGRSVYGHCALQDAVCRDKDSWDPTNACEQLPYPIDCKADMCAADNRHYCMKSGRSVFGHCDLQEAVCREGEEWDPTEACLKLPYAVNCDLPKPRPCAMDLAPHCMLSGNTVKGHCELQDAICDDGDMWDPTEACLDLPYPINCGPDPQPCGMDLRRHCMTSGRSVYGHCAFQDAICRDGDTWDPTNACEQLPYPIDCNATSCALDMRPYCMKSGRTVYGHCGLQEAVCREEEEWDPTEACLKLPYVVNCDLPKPRPCAMDLAPYCMLSGNTVKGHCELQDAICDQGDSYIHRGPCDGKSLGWGK